MLPIATHMLVHVHELVCATAQPQELSILNDPKEKGTAKTSGQNPNAGWYNRFVQSGKSDHETKTNGCFGGRVHASVCATASHRRRLQSFAACCRPYDCVCCMHMCTVACLYVCVHIYMHKYWCVHVLNTNRRTHCAGRQQLVHRQLAPDPVHRVDAGEAG